MDRRALEESWAVTRAHLARAEAMVSSSARAATVHIARVADYLAHNELELALDELAELGEAVALDHAFWNELALAAVHMKLEKKAERFRSRLGG